MNSGRWLSRFRAACCLLLLAQLASCRRSDVPVGDRATGTDVAQQSNESPTPRFTDVSAAVGIKFRHTNGAGGRKYMPETMGSGCAFLDYDNDGWQDILLINGQHWSEVAAFRRSGEEIQHGGAERDGSGRNRSPAMALYRNEGTGRFVDVTAAAGLDRPLYGMGVAVGDWDNDGYDDLAVTALGGVRLFHNRSGERFVETAALHTRRSSSTEAAGAAPSPRTTPDGGWPTGAAWLDFDRDGWLDLFVCHYVRWTPETDVFWSLDGVQKSYTTPEKYQGESCRLYRNRNGGSFLDVTREAGIDSPRSKCLGVAVCDYDSDGWPDILVSNDTEPNMAFHNQGDGTFDDVATELGMAVAESGKPKAGMGIDTGDDRNDGTESVLVTNFAGEQISLYRKDATGQYLDESAAAGVGLPSQRYLGFGAFFFDADLDGWLDIFVSNGHVMDDIERRNTGVTYAEPALLFLNDRQGRYHEVSQTAGRGLSAPQVGRGAAHGDFDNDGDLDLLLTTNGGPARLLRNDTAAGSGWLKVQLQGGPSNRNALGARVQVWTGDRVMLRTVRSGSSYLSASDRRLTFGLGAARGADRIEIRWPSGAVQSLGPVPRNRWLRITEGRSGSAAVPR
jgi:enediyne biosynthesis protein E4